MRIKLKTYKVKCDRCEATEVVMAQHEFDALPKGWGTEDVHDCGMTGYTRTDDLCPNCLKKSKTKK